MMQENGMMLEVLPLEAGGARLVRVYGQDPCVVLPGSVPAPAGGSWPITELGDYCFSEKPRSLPASDAVCRYQVDDTGAVRLTRAFGQAVGGSACRTACRSLAAVPFTTAGSCACLRWEPRA